VGSLTFTIAAESNNALLKAEAVEIRWASTDLSLLPGYSTSYSSSTPISSSDGSKSTVSESASSTLSNGAIAGIVLGALIAAVLVVAGVMLWMMRRRRKRRTSEHPAATDDSQPAELPSEELQRSAVEVESKPITSRPAAAELSADTPHGMSELDPTSMTATPGRIISELASQPSDPLSSHLAGTESPSGSAAKPVQWKGEVAPSSVTDNSEAVVTDLSQMTVDEEVAVLNQKKSRIEEQRRQLLQLQELDREEAEIEARLCELQR